MLATLSLGPVGLADQLTARPDNASADISTNRTLALATCAETGDLLQPSFPLVPVERMISGAGGMGSGPGGAGLDCFGPRHIAYTFGCGTHLLATYTATPITGGSSPAVFYQAVGFHAGRGAGPGKHTQLYQQDLAPLVDWSALPSPTLGDVPTGSFAGTGSTFAGNTTYVWWKGRFTTQRSCQDVVVNSWSGSVNMSLPSNDDFSQVLVSPVMQGVALLGEVGKVTPVSVYRFSSIYSNSSGMTVHLRGKPDEYVTILFALGKDNHCVQKTVAIALDGTQSVFCAAAGPL